MHIRSLGPVVKTLLVGCRLWFAFFSIIDKNQPQGLKPRHIDACGTAEAVPSRVQAGFKAKRTAEGALRSTEYSRADDGD